MNINLHIERLVLDGLPVCHVQGAMVEAAVAAELGRLLMESGVRPELRSGGAFPSAPGGSIALTPESKPSVIGRQIAAAVYGSIGGSR